MCNKPKTFFGFELSETIIVKFVNFTHKNVICQCNFAPANFDEFQAVHAQKIKFYMNPFRGKVDKISSF